MPHDTMLKRIRGEYLEMPGLRLTLAQAQRMGIVGAMLVASIVVSAVVLSKRPGQDLVKTWVP